MTVHSMDGCSVRNGDVGMDLYLRPKGAILQMGVEKGHDCGGFTVKCSARG